MKKYLILAIVICTAVFLFSNCHTQKKSQTSASGTTTPKLTYTANVKSVIEANCSPCHIPAKGGNKKALDSYDNLKSSIDEVIRRVQLNPDDRGFMPFKHQKLSDSTIAIFTQWRDAGMPE